jgi:hypothetical protein
VAFELEDCRLSAGTVVQNALLRLDGVALTVPALKVMYCRTHSAHQCTVGAQFEPLGADEERLLRRWIAAAQAALVRPRWDEPAVEEARGDGHR